MAITVGSVCYRNPALSPAEFRDYFENTHVPLLLRLCLASDSAAKPLSYRRNYTHVVAQGLPFPQQEGLPLMLHGDAKKVDWDCISEVTFADVAAFQAFAKAYGMNMKVINEDEKRFFDVDRLLVTVYETDISED